MAQDSALVAKVETITPKVAHELLSTKQKPDRAVVNGYVQQLANDMRLGFWTVNGESIKVTNSGEVIDGQHRLRACIVADRPFDSLVVRDLPDDDEIQFTTDNGRRRSIGDALRIRGEKYANELAGVAAMQWRFLTNQMMRTQGPSVPVALKLVTRFGGSELDNPILNEPMGMRTAVRVVSQLRHSAKGFAMSPVLTGWGWLVFGEIDRRTNGTSSTNEEFWSGVWLGIELIEDDPRLLLRNRLLQHYADIKGRSKLNVSEMRALTIKAWNAYSDGKTMTSSAFRWRQVGPAREGFPIINNQDVLEDWFRIRL